MKANTLRLRMTAGLLGCAVTMTLAGTAAAQPVKTVRVWHTETEPQTIKAFNDIARRFEAKHPGVKIEAEGLAWGDLEGKIMAALAAGARRSCRTASRSPARRCSRRTCCCRSTTSSRRSARTTSGIRSSASAIVDGKQFGLVHAAGTSLLIYRKDLADKAGLKPPKTWADLIANAKALTHDKQDGKVDIYGITLPGDNLFINIMLGELIKANGGALFDKSEQAADDRQEDDRDARFWRELVKYAPPGWEGHGYLQTFQNLYGQKAAMMFHGYGRGAGMIEKFAPKEMANDKTFDVWVKPHGPSGTEPAAQVDEEPWMLFKDAKNTKEAVEFLKFFYQDDNYLEYVATVPIHLFPITKSLRNSADYQNSRDDPALEGLDRRAAAVSRQGPGQADAGGRLGRHDQQAVPDGSARLRHPARHGAWTSCSRRWSRRRPPSAARSGSKS